MTVPPQIQALRARIDAMSLRERLIIATAVLAVIWALWDALLLQSLDALENARQGQLTSVATQVRDVNASIAALAARDSGSVEAAARRRLAELRARNIELDARLREVTRELVDPAEMPALLESILTKTGELRLVRMETLPAEPIIAEGGETGFFRHGLAVEVEGSYLDTLRYLEALESLNWRFFWESVELEVLDHPASAVRIVVYTLGPRAGVIGV